jgi:hypothetical protein
MRLSAKASAAYSITASMLSFISVYVKAWCCDWPALAAGPNKDLRTEQGLGVSYSGGIVTLIFYLK